MIRRTNQRMTICLFLLVATLLFIWGNSLLPASASSALSRWVGTLLGMDFQGSGEAGQGVLRKLAHFSEFAFLGGVLFWLYAMMLRKQRSVVAAGFGCGVLTACVDEWLQSFSSGRNPSLIDVSIDSAGAAVGLGLLLIGYIISSNKKLILEEN